jgi:hypothetical protein
MSRRSQTLPQWPLGPRHNSASSATTARLGEYIDAVIG